MKNKGIKEICLLALLSLLLVVQEELLTFLPNISLTILLMVLYAKTLGGLRTWLIILVYQLIDTLIAGGANLLFGLFQLIGWSLVPVVFNLIFHRVEKPIWLACLAFLSGLLYSWVMAVGCSLMWHVKLFAYLAVDIPWELILGACGFITVLLLFAPLKKVIDKLLLRSGIYQKKRIHNAELDAYLKKNLEAHICESASPRPQAKRRKSAEILVNACELSPSFARDDSESLEFEPHQLSLKLPLPTRDESFTTMLLRKIDESGMTDAQCYRKAHVDRKLFSRIRQEGYHPSKQTALAFALALELTVKETEELLDKAGYSLSKSLVLDTIVRYFLELGIYDMNRVNEALYAYDQPLLGQN